MAEELIQRRLSAILAADVVGYSRMMEGDEAGTMLRLKRLWSELFDPNIDARGGRIVKTMGDGVLVEFGSAVSAVESAIAVQEAIGDFEPDLSNEDALKIRVGINIGDVIIDGDDILGSGVNVAARLESLCEPGRVYISASVYDQVEGRIENYFFDDLGEHTVKNIARPIRVYAISDGSIPTTTVVTTTPEAEKSTLAILPFANISGDPDQEYFSDGISEDIITALSRARWFRVVPRNSSFAYKGTDLGTREIADELDVRYLLEGSVRQVDDRVIISVQMLDGSTENNLWSERIDRKLDDIFKVQDEIIAGIAIQIDPELHEEEINHVATVRPQNLNAWDVYQRGMWLLLRRDNPDFQQAMDRFRRAAQLDSKFGAAYSGIAQCCFNMLHYRQVDDVKPYIEHGMQAAQQAVELDGDDPIACWMLGYSQYLRGDYEEAAAELEMAVRLDPLHIRAWLLLGRTLLNMGSFSDAVTKMNETVRLCPKDPMIGIAMACLAEAHFHLREYNQTKDWSQRASRRAATPRMWGRAAYLAALGHSDDTDGAEQSLQDTLETNPDFSLALVREHFPVQIPDVIEHVVDGLRKAGVRE